MSIDALYMQRCIDLALRGAGNVAPNPLVGCVIVHEGRIIGEGHHEKYGGPHAEVNAINSVKAGDQELLKESTLYVNLEPCAHHGKTPPCADLIVEKKIARVVIGCIDPNPFVAGKGIEKLEHAHVQCEVGTLSAECKNLNRRFFTFILKKRPYIILKWAQSSDGMIAPKDKARINISNQFSRTLTHRWRSEEAAIMVGTGTALYDDPKLDTRLWMGKNPVRVIIDRSLRLPSSLHAFDHAISTIVFTEKEKASEDNLSFVTIGFDSGTIRKMLQHLHDKEIQSMIVEGGAQLIQQFISENMWDEARVFISPNFIGDGIKAPQFKTAASDDRKFLISEGEMDGDRLLIFENQV